jgi:hypothetical protein
MNLSSAIPVRFEKATVERLKAVSVASGVPVAQLVRLATERYLKNIEKKRSIIITVAGTDRSRKSHSSRKP